MSELFEAFGFASSVADDYEESMKDFVYDPNRPGQLFDLISKNGDYEADIIDYMDTTNGDGVDYVDGSGLTPLILSCKKSLEGVISRILKYPDKCHMAHVDSEGNTALMYACRAKQTPSVMTMLSYPDLCGMDNKNETGDTALIIACESSAYNIVEEMLKNHYNKCDPLHVGCVGVTAIQILLPKICDSETSSIWQIISDDHPELILDETVDENGDTVLMRLLKSHHYNSKQIVDILLDNPSKCNLTHKNNEDHTALSLMLAENDMFDQILKLLDYQGNCGLDLMVPYEENSIDTFYTPLMIACRKRYMYYQTEIEKLQKICIKMIDHPSDSRTTEVINGKSALTSAFIGEKPDVITRLLDEPGISYGHAQGMSDTLLYMASQKGWYGVVLKLLTRPEECMVNCKNTIQSLTALDIASYNMRMGIVTELLSVPDCDIHTRGIGQRYPIQHIVREFKHYGSDAYTVTDVDNCINMMLERYDKTKLSEINFEKSSFLWELCDYEFEKSALTLIGLLSKEELNIPFENRNELLVACANSPNVAMKLIDTGIYDVDVRDTIGDTCLMGACNNSCIPLVERLLEMCSDENICAFSDAGDTALARCIDRVNITDEIEGDDDGKKFAAEHCFRLVHTKLSDIGKMTISQYGKRHVPISTLAMNFSGKEILDYVSENEDNYSLKHIISLLNPEKIQEGIKHMQKYEEIHDRVIPVRECTMCCEDTKKHIMFDACKHVFPSCDPCMDQLMNDSSEQSCPFCNEWSTVTSVYVV